MPVSTRYPTSYTVTYGGAWTDPTYAYFPDGNFTFSPATGLDVIQYHNFGFSSAVIPDGSVINDVDIEFKYHAGTLGGDKGGTVTLFPGSGSYSLVYDDADHTVDTDGDTDPLTWSDVRNGTLYVEAVNWVISGSSYVSLDYVRVTIDWTGPEFQIP